MTDEAVTDVTQDDPVPPEERPQVIPDDEVIGEGQPRPTVEDEDGEP